VKDPDYLYDHSDLPFVATEQVPTREIDGPCEQHRGKQHARLDPLTGISGCVSSLALPLELPDEDDCRNHEEDGPDGPSAKVVSKVHQRCRIRPYLMSAMGRKRALATDGQLASCRRARQ